MVFAAALWGGEFALPFSRPFNRRPRRPRRGLAPVCCFLVVAAPFLITQ